MTKKKPKFDVSEAFLRRAFKEAKENDEFLWPDEAIKKLDAYWAAVMKQPAWNIEDGPPIHRLNASMSEAKRLHYFAVDLFYKTYFPEKKGAPSMTIEHAKFLLELSEKGLTHREIAKQAGIPIENPEDAEQVKDRVRKRINKAKKMLKEQS